jgi:acyl-CoA reductase-like NAD-dependent aldehyde dehydrogenase
MRKTDEQIGEDAEREAAAQLAVAQALKPLTQADRARVLRAMALLMQADELIPGLFAAVGK